MAVDLVPADREVLEIDHTAAQWWRQVDAEEGRMVAEVEVGLDLIAVTECLEVGQLVEAVQQVAPVGVDGEAHDEGQAFLRSGLEVDETKVPGHGDRLARWPHSKVDRPVGSGGAAEAAKGGLEATLVKQSLEAMQAGDLVEAGRVLEGQNRMSDCRRNRLVVGDVDNPSNERPDQPIDGRRDPRRIVVDICKQGSKVASQSRSHVEESTRPAAVQRCHDHELGEHLGMEEVASAEAVDRLTVDGCATAGPIAGAEGHRQPSLPDRSHARDPVKKGSFVPRHHERHSAVDGQTNPPRDLETPGDSGPAELTEQPAELGSTKLGLGPYDGRETGWRPPWCQCDQVSDAGPREVEVGREATMGLGAEQTDR